MSAPTNISALTATALGALPQTVTEDMDTAGSVWFSYTTGLTDIEISVFASADGGTATVGLAIYDGPAGAPTLYLGLTTTLRQPFAVPVSASTTYFIKVTNPGAPTPLGVDMTLSVLPRPTLAIPPGALIIGDDASTQPAVIVSATAPTVLGVATNTVGGQEFMDTVASGVLLTDDLSVVGSLRRFTADLTTESAIALPGAPSIDGIRSNRNATFFVATHTGGVATVYAVSEAGVVSGTSWVLPNTVWTFAPNPAGTILYWVRSTGTASLTDVHRWDLVNNIALSDLIADDAPFFVTQDMLVLSDGTLLIGYRNTGIDFKVKHISAAGAVMTTYDFGNIEADAPLNYRMSLAPDQLSFWLKTNPIQGTDADTQLLQKVRISDGAILVSNTFPTFKFGVGQLTASPTAPYRFGPGPSTPITVLMAAVTVPTTFTPPVDPPGSLPAPCCPSPPSTTPLDSPEPNAGGNTGGITPPNATPCYSGGSGSVPVGADPTIGETLTGKAGVHLWAEVTHTIYPAGTVQETLRYAMTDLDDTTRKEGRLQSIGDVEYSLSDAQGNMTAGTVDVHISDVDGRPIGTRLIDATKRYFQRDEIAVFALSDEGRRASARARLIGRALLQDDTYGTPVVAQFSGTDPLFCDGGAFGPDKKFPSWSIPDCYTYAPTDVYKQPLPVILGVKSDEGAVDPVTNLSSARGLIPVRFVGMDTLATGSGGGSEPWGRFNVCQFAIYSICGLYASDLGGGLFGTGTATSDGATPSIITFSDSPDLTGVAIDGTDTIDLNTTVGRQTATIIAKTTTTVTVSATISAAIATAVDWTIGMAVPTRVKIDLSTRNGQDCMVFGYPNYARPTNYEDITDSNGETYRVTDIWIRGALLEDHLAGRVTLAVNAVGVEDVGDGSGLPITDYFTAFNWWLENCVIRNSKGGLYPASTSDLLKYSDGTYMIKGSSFVDAQATADAGFGSSFQVSAYFGDALSMRDAVQLWNDNGGCRLGVNEDGQIFVWLIDRMADTSAWPRIDHVSRVFGPVTRTHPNSEIENVTQGQCDWDGDARRYRNPLVQFPSASGILHNKNLRKSSKLIDGKLTSNPLQFNYVLQQRLTAAQDGPFYVTFTGDIGLLDYPVGSGIQFTSVMGPGAAGFVQEPLIILTKRFRVAERLVELTCLDVGSGGSNVIVPAANQFTITDTGGPVITDTLANAPLLVNL